MTLNSMIDKDEKKFRIDNEDLIQKAVTFKKQSLFDITSGIDSSELLKKHKIGNVAELACFVQQLPEDLFPQIKNVDIKTVRVVLTCFAASVASLIAFCLENDWIEKSVPLLTTFIASSAAGLIVFVGIDCLPRLHDKHKTTTASRLLQMTATVAAAFATGLIVWRLQLNASIFTTNTFQIITFTLRVTLLVVLFSCLLRIFRLPFVERIAREQMGKSSLMKTYSNLKAAFRLYQFRDEIFALCNHTRLIQILDRAQEKKCRKEISPSKSIRIIKPQIQPVWFKPKASAEPDETRIAKMKDEGLKEIKALYLYKEKHRASLDDSSGSLMSTFVLRHTGKRIIWTLIDHNESPIVFVLNSETDRNKLAEEVIASVALFNPPEIIDQFVNDPLHKGLYFTGYKNTVSVINDINQLWKMIHTSMSDAAKRQITPGQPVDEINMSLYEQNEAPEGFVRWKIVHFLEPYMSVRMNDLLVSEEGWQYGFLPVFYFSEEEWNASSEITNYLRNNADVTVYRVTDTAIKNMNEEEE